MHVFFPMIPYSWVFFFKGGAYFENFANEQQFVNI